MIKDLIIPEEAKAYIMAHCPEILNEKTKEDFFIAFDSFITDELFDGDDPTEEAYIAEAMYDLIYCVN